MAGDFDESEVDSVSDSEYPPLPSDPEWEPDLSWIGAELPADYGQRRQNGWRNELDGKQTVKKALSIQIDARMLLYQTLTISRLLSKSRISIPSWISISALTTPSFEPGTRFPTIYKCLARLKNEVKIIALGASIMEA